MGRYKPLPTIPYYMEIMGVDRPWHIWVLSLKDPQSQWTYTVVKVDGATPKRWLTKGPWETNTWELRHLLSTWYKAGFSRQRPTFGFSMASLRRFPCDPFIVPLSSLVVLVVGGAGTLKPTVSFSHLKNGSCWIFRGFWCLLVLGRVYKGNPNFLKFTKWMVGILNIFCVSAYILWRSNCQ